MDIITFPKQTVNENKTRAEDTLSICNGIPELEVPYNKAIVAFNNYVEGLQKGFVSSESVQQLDKVRDTLYKGFVINLRAELLYPHTDETTLNAQNEIRKITKKYKLEAAKLPMDEESAIIDSFLAEMADINLTLFPNSGLARWSALLKDANEAFKQGRLEHNAEKAENDSQESASDLFPELKHAMDGLLAFACTNALYSESENLKSAYMQLLKLYN